MHSWESMPPINYEQSWCDTPLTTKIDPPTPNIKRKFATRMRKNSTSNECFSPQKTDETDFQNFYFEHQTFNTFSGMPRALGFNPLTPPGYPNAIFSNTSQQQESLIQEQASVSHQGKSIFFNNFSKVDSTTSLTPSHTPPMDVTPPKSPKLKSENLEKEADTNSNCNFSGDDSRSNHSDNDDESIRMPTVNSHGKYKKFKCKQCKFVAVTKLHFWEHTKEHIRPEKMLKCLKCPFVTEYKHHLEYHLRNHDGTKPFQCGKCSYSCVNKSMLNSHLKSHSNIYQYRCADCSYATKYCHSLKLHLRKYKHKPAMVLNEDGTPNPLPIIDVYGTRRGPKMKSGKKKSSQKQKKSSESTNIPNATLASMLLECDNNDQPHPSNILPNVLPNTLANMFQNNGHLPFLPYLNINLHMLAAQQQAALAKLSPSTGHEGNRQQLCDSSDEDCDRLDDINNIEEDLKRGVMDLSHTISLKPNIILDTSKNAICSEAKNEFNQSIIATPTLNSAKVTHRRKGRAFKLDLETPKDENDECHEEASNKTISNKTDHSDISTSNLIHCDEINSSSVTSPVRIENSRCCNNLSGSVKLFECKFCEISFKDAVLYTIHMGYHGYNDVFKCNMCGEKCDDRVGFFLHIARNSHS